MIWLRRSVRGYKRISRGTWFFTKRVGSSTVVWRKGRWVCVPRNTFRDWL